LIFAFFFREKGELGEEQAKEDLKRQGRTAANDHQAVP